MLLYHRDIETFQFRGNEAFFIHQIEMRKNCPVEGISNLLRYSCDTKHLVLVYEHIDFGPLNSLIAVNVSPGLFLSVFWPFRHFFNL